MFEKVYTPEFSSQARTLYPSEVTHEKVYTYYDITYSATHESGWTISGIICEDYFEWVNDFEASHPIFGKVWGNFEGTVYADSEEAFEHFLNHHGYTEWDYYDI